MGDVEAAVDGEAVAEVLAGAAALLDDVLEVGSESLAHPAVTASTHAQMLTTEAHPQ